ncbi:uncharacterized protein LOC116298083 isoform X2 [Actinia tenebrosa]|uniref:Uncharacterized protein LOC116298083 isoform X2 n=1 Tax=Actinia tenebrosa TaxID=6105 RepID=A0A6P8IAN5_ACTTE|nr:uncharacterized protein LOC116298083 isoform X2 [Actinia tenebrosa]
MAMKILTFALLKCLVILWTHDSTAELSATQKPDLPRTYLFNKSSTFTIPGTTHRLRVLLVGGGGYGCRGNAPGKAGRAGKVKVVIIDNIYLKNRTLEVKVGKGGKFPRSFAPGKDDTSKESSFISYRAEGGKNCDYIASSFSTDTRCFEHFKISHVTPAKDVKSINISACQIQSPTVLLSGDGGVLIDNNGPSAMPGKSNRSSAGGIGYGAGGGSGGNHKTSEEGCDLVDGGDGAPGVVYIEVVPKVCRKPVSVLFAIAYSSNSSFTSQKKTIQNIIKLIPQRKVGVLTFKDKTFQKVKLREYNDNQQLFSAITNLKNAYSTEIINFTNVYSEAILAFREEEASRNKANLKVSFSKTLVMFTHSWKKHVRRSQLLSLKKELKLLGVKIILVGLDEDLTDVQLREMVNDDDFVYTSDGDDYDLVLPMKEPYIIDTICRDPLYFHNLTGTPTKSITTNRVPSTSSREKNANGLQKDFEFLLNYDMKKVNIKNTTEIERVMNIADNLILNSHRIPNNTKTAPGLKVIQFLENFGLQMASTVASFADGDSGPRNFNTKHLGLTVATVNLISTTSIDLSNALNKGHVIVPKDAFQGNGRGTVVMLSSNPVASMKKENGTVITSQLVSININPKSPDVFKKPVEITFDINQDLLDGKRASCEFWEQKKREDFPHGFWSPEGCKIVSKDDASVTCHCNHLTSFAVLTRVHVDETPSENHARYLTIITYVGCSLSMLGCLLTIIIHAVLPSLRTERAFIHINLVTAIFLGQGFFFIAALLEGPRAMCYFTAVALYFFYLSVFTWMLVEGLHIYCLVIRVFHSGHERKRLYTAIGWLLPLIITVVCASAFRGDFVSNKLCWLSVESGAIWAFVGPAIAIIAVKYTSIELVFL